MKTAVVTWFTISGAQADTWDAIADTVTKKDAALAELMRDAAVSLRKITEHLQKRHERGR